MTTIWNFIKPHLFYWIIAALALFAFHTWLQEHDARLLAETQVKQSEEVVTDLRSQIASRATETAAAKQVIIREVHDAATPAQQIALIPKLAEVPLNPAPLPDAPSAVKVELAPLIAQLAKCKDDAISLGACRQDTLSLDSIIFEKEKEVKALGQKPGFWKRLVSDSRKIGVGAAIGLGVGIALHH